MDWGHSQIYGLDNSEIVVMVAVMGVVVTDDSSIVGLKHVVVDVGQVIAVHQARIIDPDFTPGRSTLATALGKRWSIGPTKQDGKVFGVDFEYYALAVFWMMKSCKGFLKIFLKSFLNFRK